jgi:hypothetical protein
LLLLLELLLERGDILLHQLVVELRVDVVRVGAERVAVGHQGVGPELERLLRLLRLRGLALPELRVADVVGEARAPAGIGVAARNLSERRQRVVELAGLVACVAEVEVQARRVGVVDQRLVVVSAASSYLPAS